MDEQYLIAAARYIELNPVKAGVVKRPQDYKWSSAKAHLQGKDDVLVKAGPLLEIIDDRPKAFGKGFIRRRIPDTPQA
jgi:putative transposase